MSPMIELSDLGTMTIDQLRIAWSGRFGDTPPRLQSKDLMRRVFAERLQTEMEAGDVVSDKRLQQAVARHRPGRRTAPRTAVFKTGSRLERLWQGQVHQVDVVEGGFEWRGRRFKSLSQIAREITGVRWNGPRFFGLREAKG